jgi:hypothetical protein
MKKIFKPFFSLHIFFIIYFHYSFLFLLFTMKIIKYLISIILLVLIFKIFNYNSPSENFNGKNKFVELAKIVVIHNPQNTKTFNNIDFQQKEIRAAINEFNLQTDFSIYNQINPQNINLTQYNIKYPWYSERTEKANINDKVKVEKEEISTYITYMNLFNDFANYANKKGSEMKSWFIILNDNFDIIPNKFGQRTGFINDISNLIYNLPNDADIVFLGYSDKVKCEKYIKNNIQVCKPTLPLFGLNGYLITKSSSEKIFNLLQYIDVPIENKMTQLIVENKIKAYITNPPLIDSLDI